MTTWFIRPDVGTDSNSSAGNGDSFATTRKKLGNLTAAALAPGDSIRYIRSPAAAALSVNGTFSVGRPAAVNISSSTNASPIVLTLPSGHGLVDGDTVLVDDHTTNTKANGVWKIGSSTSTIVALLHEDGTNSTGNGVGGATRTIRNINSAIIRRASSLVKNIALHGNTGEVANWTASANVTASIITTNYREGAECLQLVVDAGFTTGKVAYYTLPATLDLSAFNKISFWIRQSAGTAMSASNMQIKLCSDTIGDTPVNTLTIAEAMQSLNYWHAKTIDSGAALGSSIASVAVYLSSDQGAQTFTLDNMFACNNLNLTNGVGKASGNYWNPMSIVDTRIMIDTAQSHIFSATNPPMGILTTAETVALYYRWLADKVNALNDFVIAVDPDSTPHIWKRTTPGTSGSSSPSWNLSGTTSDGSTIWTYVSQLPSVTTLMLGPKIPTVL